MSDNNAGLPEGVKKVKFLDLFMMAVAGKEGIDKKLVIKDLSQKEKHITFKMTENKLDIHETKEGTAKEYQSLANMNFDFLNLKDASQFRDDIKPEEIISKLNLQVIDINADEYKDCIAIATNQFLTGFTIKKNEASFNDVSELPICKLHDIAARGYDSVLVLKGGAPKFIVFNIEAKYVKFNLDLSTIEGLFSLMNASVQKLFEQLGMTPAEFEKVVNPQGELPSRT